MAMSFKGGVLQAFDDNGDPLPGAKLYFYDAGTTTPRTVYSDAALSVAITQPVVADSAGRFAVIYQTPGTFKYKLTTSADVLVEEKDNMDPGLGTAAGALPVASGGTGSTTASGARSNLSVPSQAAFDALDTRVTDVEDILDAPLIAPNATTTYASSINPDFTANQVQTITLTGNLTLGATVTGTAGQEWTILLVQDATGNRTVSFGAGFKFSGGVTPKVSTTANAVDVLTGYMRTASEAVITGIKIQDGLQLGAPHVILEEQQTSGTNGGTFTSGADRTRTLNTEVRDFFDLCTLSSNQFTLGAGTYAIRWSAPAYQVNSHQTLLYNVTDTAEVKRGTNAVANAGSQSQSLSVGLAIVTIASSKAFELRHRCQTTRSTDGLGLAGSFGTEVYSRVEITKIAS